MISETGVGYVSAKPRSLSLQPPFGTIRTFPPGVTPDYLYSPRSQGDSSSTGCPGLLNNLTIQIGFSETMSGYLPL
jgi:hypothetical protein